jgi:transcriptional regulator with PAS, ATPase and Fis domain
MSPFHLTHTWRHPYHGGNGSINALRQESRDGLRRGIRVPGPRPRSGDGTGLGLPGDHPMSFERAVAPTGPSSGQRTATARPVVRPKSFEVPPLITGRSPAMLRVMNLIRQVAATSSTVLVYGETGSGKEVVARNIHQASHLREQVFLPVNCGAIPDHLLESQLFGHAKGAFTGADTSNEGLFHRARGGTIFLDEIGELPPLLQVKLLRLIEEKEILPLGTVNPIEVDVRIVAATNQDLHGAVKAGRFREDLFYRLNVITLHIPPLRDRREDIPLLIDHLIERQNARLGRSYRGVDDAALQLILALPLRGNVRELDHLIEYGMIVGDGEWIRSENLPPGIAPEMEEPDSGSDNLAAALRRFARAHIESVLARHSHDRKRAAVSLGIDLSTLYRKINELGIKQ